MLQSVNNLLYNPGLRLLYISNFLPNCILSTVATARQARRIHETDERDKRITQHPSHKYNKLSREYTLNSL